MNLQIASRTKVSDDSFKWWMQHASAPIDFDKINARVRALRNYARSVPCAHGRRLVVGQVWRHNDPRRLRGVKLLDIDTALLIAYGVNILTGKVMKIPFSTFTTGREGWSLEVQA